VLIIMQITRYYIFPNTMPTGILTDSCILVYTCMFDAGLIRLLLVQYLLRYLVCRFETAHRSPLRSKRIPFPAILLLVHKYMGLRVAGYPLLPVRYPSVAEMCGPWTRELCSAAAVIEGLRMVRDQSPAVALGYS